MIGGRDKLARRMVATGRALWLCAALAIVAFAAPARAEFPLEWLGQRVVEVKVVGEQAARVRSDELGVQKGVPLTRALLRETLDRLGGAGRWSDIQLDVMPVSGGVALLVHVTPRVVAKRIELVGNSALDDRELSRLVGVREGTELDRESFPTWMAAIRETYAAHGYHAATVRTELRDTDDPAAKVLRVLIDEGDPTRIWRIRFVGEQLPRRKGLRRVLGFRAGDLADMPRIEDGLRRAELALRQKGFYAAALGEPTLVRDGDRAEVVVQSKMGPHYDVRFVETGPLSRSELFEAMTLHEERLSGEGSLRVLEQRLADTYRRYGFRDVKASIVARPEVQVIELDGERWEEHTMVLEVRIDTGEQLEIGALRFPGADHFSQDFLSEQMFSYLEEELPGSTVRQPVDSDVADRIGFSGGTPQARRDVPKPIVSDPRRIFYAPAYESAISHIRELYRADGYLAVEVGPARVEAAPNGPGWVSIIPVREGPRTFLYSVRIENNREVAGRELLSAAALVREAPFSYLKLEEARLRMLEVYQERGFFYARIEPNVRMSEDGTRAEVSFHVDEGYVVRVGGIEVRGAERSSRSMILNRVRLKVGEPYRPSLARATEETLLALDVFTSVTVAPDERDLPARVKNVVVTVTERKTQWLGWSAGFSTGEGVRGGFEYGYRNLFGSALSAAFRGQLGYQFVFLDEQIEQRYESLSTEQRIEYQTTLTLGIPYIPHMPKVQASVDLSLLTDIQRDFRMEKESIVGSVVYRPVRRWTFNVAEELERSDFLVFEQLGDNSNLSVNDLVPQGENTLASTQFTFAWDRRNRAYNPRSGLLVSVTSEWARTLNAEEQTIDVEDGPDKQTFESNLLRFMGSVAFYIPLAPKLVFASQWRYGRVLHLTAASESYPNRRFYLGGTNFRGFNQNQMIPQDIQDEMKREQMRSPGDAMEEPEVPIVSRGGETFIAGQNELRFPLVGDLYGGLFVDIGNLWANPKNFSLRQLEPVVGAGLRFQTPVASLAFDYGIRVLETTPSNIAGAFQFAFQTF